MFTFDVKYQQEYSRGELLLRTFFGIFYMILPHMFILFFVSIWASILRFVTFWAILFTGEHPRSMFDFQLGLIRWTTRLNARLWNVADGYPAFGMQGKDDATTVDITYPETLNRGMVVVRFLFGVFYVFIPHIFILYFRALFVSILSFVGFWIVLFTGQLPQNFHEWIVGQMRWTTRLSLYMGYMTDEYPAFTGDKLPHEG
jgi:hypothetical protein